MDPKDRLAFELAMVALQDAREECLRSLEDVPPAMAGRRADHWWSIGRRAARSERGDGPIANRQGFLELHVGRHG